MLIADLSGAMNGELVAESSSQHFIEQDFVLK
jgi:hypothetical protein